MIKNLFSILFFGYTPYWDCKATNAYHVDSPGVHTGEKSINLSIEDRIRLKCDVIHGSAVDGVSQPKLYSFVVDKPSK